MKTTSNLSSISRRDIKKLVDEMATEHFYAMCDFKEDSKIYYV